MRNMRPVRFPLPLFAAFLLAGCRGIALLPGRVDVEIRPDGAITAAGSIDTVRFTITRHTGFTGRYWVTAETPAGITAQVRNYFTTTGSVGEVVLSIRPRVKGNFDVMLHVHMRGRRDVLARVSVLVGVPSWFDGGSLSP